MEVYLKSDIGLVRQSNQDACRCGSFSDNAVWAVLCDGMGGANGGKVASTVAVNTISDLLLEKYSNKLNDEQLFDTLVDIVQQANSRLYEMQKKEPELRGMGTTVELVLVKGKKIHIVHAGDSRVYSIRRTKIKQLTVDHSLVQEMVDSGQISPQEAMVHPNKNYITRALGVVPEIRLDYIEADFDKADLVLLCSDGLSNYVVPQQLVKLSLDNRGEALTNALIESAKSLGGGDNITVAVISA